VLVTRALARATVRAVALGRLRSGGEDRADLLTRAGARRGGEIVARWVILIADCPI
jgi:hypothetical protein